jgi:predicted short-subunit dehydrogenase-like oxidoreductase (DUF2520 family)
VSERIAVIGAGRVGLALGAALQTTGAADRVVFYGRSLEPPPHPIFDIAAPPGDDAEAPVEYRIWPAPLPAGTTVALLAVPDDALAEVAHDLARTGTAPTGCAALHHAGALTADVLAPLHAAGYAVGSMHPLLAIADPWIAAERLSGVTYALAGEPAAVAAGRRLADALGGFSVVVPATMRPLYHAAAVLASNGLVAVLAAAVRLFAQVGISEPEAVQGLVPLVRGTLDNLENFGVRGALTGPVVRGDVDTVRLHLARLSAEDRLLYCALGNELLRLARAAGLDERRAHELDALLTGG